MAGRVGRRQFIQANYDHQSGNFNIDAEGPLMEESLRLTNILAASLMYLSVMTPWTGFIESRESDQHHD